MELKLYNLPSSLKSSIAFNRTAYGIEMNLPFFGLSVKTLLIAPLMELKSFLPCVVS